MISLAINLCGQCCRRHVVGQKVISDISVLRSWWSICILCFESNNTNLLLRLLIDALETSILLQISNIACRTTWLRVLGDHGFSDVTAPYLLGYPVHTICNKLKMTNCCEYLPVFKQMTSIRTRNSSGDELPERDIGSYPSCVYRPRRRSSPGTISVKFRREVKGWLRYIILPKISTPWVSRTNVTDDRQTDRRQTDLR